MYRVEDLSQFVGQKFNCVVTEANPEKRNLVLSRRAVLEREQAEAKEKLLAELEVGQMREGTVRSLQDFGAFVDLGGVDGLVHISQIELGPHQASPAKCWKSARRSRSRSTRSTPPLARSASAFAT